MAASSPVYARSIADYEAELKKTYGHINTLVKELMTCCHKVRETNKNLHKKAEMESSNMEKLLERVQELEAKSKENVKKVSELF